MSQEKKYSAGEEIANSITHGVGVLLSIAALIVLLIFALQYGDIWHVVSFSIFGGTLILLYLASTLYHSFPQPAIKRILKIIDHSAIFLLIAGTYTPFMLVHLRSPLGWTLFGVVWGLALGGIVLKSFYMSRFKRLSLVLYILMGWMSVFAFHEMFQRMSYDAILFLILGGIFYTSGVIFYIWKKLPYGHAVWHVFVLAGSIFHFFSVISLF